MKKFFLLSAALCTMAASLLFVVGSLIESAGFHYFPTVILCFAALAAFCVYLVISCRSRKNRRI